MAWTVSGLYGITFRDALDTSGLAIDLLLDSHKCAMYNNTETPNYDTETIYSATNEVTDGLGSYVAGGKALTGLTPTWAITSGTLKYDCGDVAWASSSIVSARGAKIYADALGNELIVGIDFDADFSTTNGTFTIAWHANGIFTIDYTP